MLVLETELALNKQKDDSNLNVKGLSDAQVYGQGMTVSAMEAEALHSLVKVKLSSFEHSKETWITLISPGNDDLAVPSIVQHYQIVGLRPSPWAPTAVHESTHAAEC